MSFIPKYGVDLIGLSGSTKLASIELRYTKKAVGCVHDVMELTFAPARTLITKF